MRRSSFQAERLAREYVSVMQRAHGRTPLLSLILGAEPPVTVKGFGGLGIEDAVSLHLRSVLARVEEHSLDQSSLDTLHEVVGWTTWQQVGSVVKSRKPGSAQRTLRS